MFMRCDAKVTIAAAVSAALLLLACSEAPPQPEVAAPVPNTPRPADATANLPSDSGSQTTLPSGAVTGAGQPQGTTVQADVGATGGLEPRARAEERAAAGAAAPPASGATRTDAATGEGASPTPARRAPRASKG